LESLPVESATGDPLGLAQPGRPTQRHGRPQPAPEVGAPGLDPLARLPPGFPQSDAPQAGTAVGRSDLRSADHRVSGGVRALDDHGGWAADLSQFLLDWKDDPLTAQGLDEARFQQAHGAYQRILCQGRRDHPRRRPGQGRTKQDKATNLLDRLEDYALCVLAFLIDPAVPFTNNQGEQDIRMIKVKQKISGCFRTLAGARVFARIRSYLSTCRKQGRNLGEACYQLVIGAPFMPQAPAGGP